ncbi:hypothetical protein BO443_30303 [Burkholderia orbicola]
MAQVSVIQKLSKLQGARPGIILASSLLCLYQVQSLRSPIPNRRLPTVQREWRVGLRVSQALAAFVMRYPKPKERDETRQEQYRQPPCSSRPAGRARRIDCHDTGARGMRRRRFVVRRRVEPRAGHREPAGQRAGGRHPGAGGQPAVRRPGRVLDERDRRPRAVAGVRESGRHALPVERRRQDDRLHDHHRPPDRAGCERQPGSVDVVCRLHRTQHDRQAAPGHVRL